MANQRHVDMLLRDGVGIWNVWRKTEPAVRPDLIGADLQKANLQEADLRRANLQRARLAGADLRGADLRGADLFAAYLPGANLQKAILGDWEFDKANLSRAGLFSIGTSEIFVFVTHVKFDVEGLLQRDKKYVHLVSTDRITLSHANFHGANLSWSDLRGVDFYAVNLSGADLTGANLTAADLSGADLTGANLTESNLTGAICLQTNFSKATLTGCNVYGTSAWDVNLEGTVQADLRITRPSANLDITVDNLNVAQFLYLLLENQNARALLDTITSKVVLILGRFSATRKPTLDALREALRSHPNGYIPVLFDFEPQSHRPVLETVKTLANLARFVIADLTDPQMIHAELTAIVPNVPAVPIQPIVEGNADLPTAYASWKLYPWFLAVHRYIDLPDLLANLNTSVIAPVEAHVHARKLS